MIHSENRLAPRMVLIITSHEYRRKLEQTFQNFRIPIYYQCQGHGTAPSEMLDIFGLSGSSRLLTIGLLPKFLVRDLLDAGADFIVTTAGMSVDPDDLTRKGLTEAGLTDTLYGVPALPGTTTLIGLIGGAQIIGVPACALFFKTTVFDIILPRMLAGVPITRLDLAKIGNGGLCMECKVCTFPKCPFGKV